MFLINPAQNVTVVAVPNTNCQRVYCLTIAVVDNAIMPCLGALVASTLPEVAPDKSENDGLVLVAASCALMVTVPLLEKMW